MLEDDNIWSEDYAKKIRDAADEASKSLNKQKPVDLNKSVQEFGTKSAPASPVTSATEMLGGIVGGRIAPPVDPRALPPTVTNVSPEKGFASVGYEGFSRGASPQPPQVISEGNTIGTTSEENMKIYEARREAARLAAEGAQMAADSKIGMAGLLANEADRQEAANRKLRAVEERRAAEFAQDSARKAQQASMMAGVDMVAGRFFANTEKFNSTILAAGLARAGLFDMANSAIKDSIAREYNEQRVASDMAKSRGEEANNALTRLRAIYQNDRSADLAFEALATEAAAKKLNAIVTMNQGSVDKVQVESLAKKLEADQMEALRRVNISERSITANPELQRISNKKFRGFAAGALDENGNPIVKGKPGGSGPGAGSTSAEPASARAPGTVASAATPWDAAGGRPAMGSTENAQAGAVTGVYRKNDPAIVNLRKIAKTGTKAAGMSSSDSIVVPVPGIGKIRSTVIHPDNRTLLVKGGNAYLFDEKSGDEMRKKVTLHAELANKASSLESKLSSFEKLSSGGLSPTERVALGTEIEALQKSMNSAWWRSSVDDGVIKESEAKTISSLFGGIGGWDGWMTNVANQLTGGAVPADWKNDILKMRAGVRALRESSSDGNFVDIMNRMGHKPASGPTVGFDDNGEVISAEEAHKQGRRIYTYLQN